jgi:hypothetical protein
MRKSKEDKQIINRKRLVNMMVTKKELANLNVSEIFKTGELSITITDGKHAIHNLNG